MICLYNRKKKSIEELEGIVEERKKERKRQEEERRAARGQILRQIWTHRPNQVPILKQSPLQVWGHP